VCTGASLPNPGWIQLVDIETGKPFWFHKRYRSRRDEPPVPGDDGRKGAGVGEAGARRFVELYDLDTKRRFYGDLINSTTSWTRPPKFDKLGIPYRPVWSCTTAGDGKKLYLNHVTGAEVQKEPADYDGAPPDDSDYDDPDGPPPPLPLEFQMARSYWDMRGFGEKEGGGTSVFGSKAFRKRFFVLDDGVLTYYEDEQVRSLLWSSIGWSWPRVVRAASGPELCEEGVRGANGQLCRAIRAIRQRNHARTHPCANQGCKVRVWGQGSQSKANLPLPVRVGCGCERMGARDGMGFPRCDPSRHCCCCFCIF
jgi:hypothetical protein